MDKREEALREINELIQLSEDLAGDVNEAAGRIRSEPCLFTFRSFVRTFFAYVEAVRFRLKRLALVLYDESINRCFSSAEVALLREESYDLDSRGKPVVRQRFLPLEADLRFTFRMVAQAFSKKNPLDLEGKGWQAFQSAKRLRDRVTHPKDSTDCQLSIADLVDVVDASTWLRENLIALLREIKTGTATPRPPERGNTGD